MAVNLQTQKPTTLLAALKAAIDQGKAPTWSYDKDGDFTHTPEQWKNKAWLRPTVSRSGLDLNIIRPQGGAISWEVYAVFHGRFVEFVINHGHDELALASATPSPVSGDLV